MKLTFIVPTVGRRNDLQACISSIEKAYEYSKVLSIEILVILQGENNGDYGIKTRFSKFVKFMHCEKKGLSFARNSGIKNSSGDFIVFLDDDAQIKEDFLDVLSSFILNNHVEALCGRILDTNTHKYFSDSFKDTNKRCLGRLDFRSFMGSAHVLKKSLFEEIGFYDDYFGAGALFFGAEESDMFFRLKTLRKKIAYLPDLVFFHPQALKTHPKRVFEYSYAVGAMLLKQILNDRNNFLIYLFIYVEILTKSALRVVQHVFFPLSIEVKNCQYHYKYAFWGLILGFSSYLKLSRNIKKC